jgi:hypothetical protein
MATLPSKAGAVTLMDFARSIEPDGKVARVVEALNQTNEVLTDMGWIEGNLPTGHRSTIRNGLPTAIFRQLYQGVPASKSSRIQVDDTCGMINARAEVDQDLAELNGNVGDFRYSEAMAFLEAMNQLFVSTLFYGNTNSSPQSFMGLTPRYSAISAGGPNKQNIINANGATSNAQNSVWLVGWGETTVTGIFPKASKAGMTQEDLGLIDAFDGSNNRYRAYAELWKWKCGLAVRDWRYAVRICNIDQAGLVADTTGATYKLIEYMIRAINRIPSLGMCRPVFYVNRTIKEMLSIQAMNKSTNALKLEEGADQFTVKFMGIPIRLCDQLLSTEAVVS